MDGSGYWCPDTVCATLGSQQQVLQQFECKTTPPGKLPPKSTSNHLGDKSHSWARKVTMMGGKLQPFWGVNFCPQISRHHLVIYNTLFKPHHVHRSETHRATLPSRCMDHPTLAQCRVGCRMGQSCVEANGRLLFVGSKIFSRRPVASLPLPWAQHTNIPSSPSLATSNFRKAVGGP